MAKVDWNKHRETFAQLRASKGITAREYAEHYGLNVNTARRELKKALLSDQESDQNGDQNGDHKPSGRKSDQKQTVTDNEPKTGKASNSKASGKVKGRQSHEDTPDHPRGDQKNQKSAKAKKITPPADLPEIEHTPLPRGKGRPLEPGHELRNRTGGRAKPRQQDYEVADRLMSEGIEALATNALREAVAHMHTVQRSVERAVEVLDKEIEDLQNAPPPDQEQDEGAAFGTHPTIKKAKLLMDAAYLYTTHTTMLSGVISSANKIDLERRKVEVAEEKAQITDITGNIIRQALDLRDENEWSDIKTVEYIESFGVKAPASLMARAAKAIQELQPPVDESALVSDDELDKQAQLYNKQKEELPEFVQGRRDSVSELVDELGVGDLDENGDRRSGEFVPEECDIDIDYSATSDLYGEEIPGDPDDDPGPIALIEDDEE